MEKLNIGLFIDTWFPMVDGVINVVDNYAKRLCKFANVTVFAPNVGEFDRSKFPYKIVSCKSTKFLGLDYRLPLPKLDKNFKKEIKAANLDIIHIHSPFSIGKMAANFGKKNKIPVFATFHSQFKQDFMRATHNKFISKILLKHIMKVFNSCDQCWAVNEEIGKVFKGYGYKGNPLVMKNGTDLTPVENPSKANNLVEDKFNISPTETVFLFVGRINKLKNILFIVDSLKILKERGKAFKMLFVGSGQDENLLREYVKKQGLESDIIICGKIVDREMIKSLYNRAKLFLFPSLYDASSLVQIEAASQKTPTVFLEGAVTAGTVTKDVNGFVSENSPALFAEKIVQILNDEQYYQTVAQNAFKDLYVTWDEATEKAFEEYKKMIKEKKND